MSNKMTFEERIAYVENMFDMKFKPEYDANSIHEAADNHFIVQYGDENEPSVSYIKSTQKFCFRVPQHYTIRDDYFSISASDHYRTEPIDIKMAFGTEGDSDEVFKENAMKAFMFRQWRVALRNEMKKFCRQLADMKIPSEYQWRK